MADGREDDAGTGPTVGYVWGPVRPVVNAVAVAWLRQLAPEPEWFDVRSGSGGAEPDPAEAAGLPIERRHRVAEPSSFAPGPPVSPATIGSVLRPDEPAEDVALLAEFLRIPPSLRDAANRPRRGGHAPAVGLANCDRLRPYYPGFAANNRDRIEAMRAAGTSVVFTVTGEPAPDRIRGPFDAVVRVDAPSLEAWRKGTAFAESGPGPDRLRAGTSRALRSIPSVARILETLTARH
jgi:hypothetical protein